jgi:hypothetical protein
VLARFAKLVTTIVGQVLVSLENVSLSNVEDNWRWVLESDGGFSVNSAFISLSKEIVIGPNLSLLKLRFSIIFGKTRIP